MRIALFILISFFVCLAAMNKPLPSEDLDLKVSLFNSLRIKKLVLTQGRGTYKVYGDGKLLGNFVKGGFSNVKWVSGKAVISINGSVKGSFAQIDFKGVDYANNFKVRTITPSSEVRVFEDDLCIKVQGNRLKMLNKPELNHYIAGVVESEVGKNAHIEYYKLQSILCRTYALSNINKHGDYGFNLCDEVHCQAYKGKSRSNPDILKATAATNDLVVIDNELNLITATFHSNCGGRTMNSEDVWSLPLHYLRSIPDTFCHSEPHAKWTKSIAFSDWESYLKNKFSLNVNSVENQIVIKSYSQVERDVFFTGKEIPLKTIRKDWRLNSTYFSIEHKNDSVHLTGKGFGHGVGLCQEGAMRMAKESYSYKSILNKYYKNVNLVNLRALRFAKED